MAGITDDELMDAARAVKLEHRAASQVVRLVALSVTTVGGGIYRLEVGTQADFDWTWEGAGAFSGTPEDATGWRGEVTEVDQAAGAIYVANVDKAPLIGRFMVRPFGFLDALHELFNEPKTPAVAPALQNCLGLARGDKGGDRVACNVDLGAMTHVWGYDWAHIWGPPGTGKTYQIGRHVAAVIDAEPTERILIVSTTNRATDGAALQVGQHITSRGHPLEGRAARYGAGADVAEFQARQLEALLHGGASLLRWRFSELSRQHAAETDPDERAKLNAERDEVRRLISNGGSLVESTARVTICTAFAALQAAASQETQIALAAGGRPFTTVIIDEAGLISRAAASALALLASKRVILVGDPKQLSPISKMSRVMTTDQALWLANSGLAHLRTDALASNALMLSEQHRMHPDVRAVVSRYQYDGKLTDAPTLKTEPLDQELLGQQPRAIWYVLDEEIGDNSQLIPFIRASRGAGNKSWVREASASIIENLLKYHHDIRQSRGLFVSPFVAQARKISQVFKEINASSWTASTTHRQQGAEATTVIFDTVNAGSTAWRDEEWQRIINVGMSRAQQLLIVFASRLEMQQPYLAPLRSLLAPRVFRGVGGHMAWRAVEAERTYKAAQQQRVDKPWVMGAQLETRRAMRPVFSEEQERLCVAKLDGGPRLVRGVAGSGKTVVLAHWLARTLADKGGTGKLQHWVVYANQALKPLIDQNINEAWERVGGSSDLPKRRFEVFHVQQLLEMLEVEQGFPPPRDEDLIFNFEKRAERLLGHTRRGPLMPRAQSLFIDEAQDFGAKTLELLAQLVELRDPKDKNSKAINVFYDNAQNVYERTRPTWKEIGLDLRGRSTVMKESFRATRPIAEYALNVLARLTPLSEDGDHKELIQRGLVEQETRAARPWWRVRYNHVEGPLPVFRSYQSRTDEVSALANAVARLIGTEGVLPRDIRVLTQTESMRNSLHEALTTSLAPLNASVEIQTSGRFSNDEATVVVTTSHSFKGHEAEVVFVPGADLFVTRPKRSEGRKVLGSALYVALTRARSLLHVSSLKTGDCPEASQIINALRATNEDMVEEPAGGAGLTALDEQADILSLIGQTHRDWLAGIWTGGVNRGPIFDAGRAVIAEPLFHFRRSGRHYACFELPPPKAVSFALEDMGVRALLPGQSP